MPDDFQEAEMQRCIFYAVLLEIGNIWNAICSFTK